jgi:hypothetical protein
MSKPETSELPVDIAAERAILGAVMLDNKALAAATAAQLSSGDFFHALHQRIFRHMLKMAEAGSHIDLVTLNDAMETANDVADDEIAHIAALMDGAPRVANVEQYVGILKKKSALRRLAHFGEKLSRQALEKRADLPALLAQMRALAIEAVAPTGVGGNGHLSYSLMDFLSAEFPRPEHLVEVVNEKNEVVGGLFPAHANAMIFSMPHHLKSWFTTSLALACTTSGIKFGKLLVKRPIRTLLIQMEDFPGTLQDRMRKLAPYIEIDSANIRILPRTDHKGNQINIMLPDKNSVAAIKREIEDFAADHVIFDVLRRITNVDLNSQKDSAAFLEDIDSFHYCPSDPLLTLVHHENRKEADIMYASAGSFNLPGWATVMMQFKRKRDDEHGVSHVENEVDNKLAQSPEPMRMVLDLKSETPLRLENVEDTSGIQELRDALSTDWTVKDLGEALGVHSSNAKRRLKKMMAAALVEKCVEGKRGRSGGLARYQFVGAGA